MLIPVDEPPCLARPLNDEELTAAKVQSETRNVPLENVTFISFIGTGIDLNAAIGFALGRTTRLLSIKIPSIIL